MNVVLDTPIFQAQQNISSFEFVGSGQLDHQGLEIPLAPPPPDYINLGPDDVEFKGEIPDGLPPPPPPEDGKDEKADVKEPEPSMNEFFKEGSKAEFVRLIAQMRMGFGSKITESISYDAIQAKLLHFLQDLAESSRSDKVENFDAQLQEFCLTLFLALYVVNPEVSETTVRRIASTNVRTLFAPLTASSYSLRRDFALYMFVTGLISGSVQKFLLDIFLEFLSTASKESVETQSNFDIYFSLLTALINENFSKIKEESSINFQALFDGLVDQLLKHPSIETEGSEKVDRVLVGLLKLLTVLTPHVDTSSYLCETLYYKLFREYLFVASREEVLSGLPKCKTEATRKGAMSLLVSLVAGKQPKTLERRRDLLARVVGQLSEISIVPGYGFAPNRQTKSVVGYVGLKNQGNTCYMNSCIQQFYMMPQLRKSILSAPVDFAKEKKEENLLFQLQQLFGFLNASDKQFYDTLPFCLTYKDESGRPIDVRVQQDAQEFFNVFVDRVEFRLKNTPEAHALRDTVIGRITSQMICLGGCGSIRERNDDFYTISVPIQSKANIYESLEAYVNPELLSGVNCDQCGKKTDTHMRTVLSELPNTMVFHLKRFQLNFETFMNEKLNDRFEFFQELNLEPYTKEGMARKDAKKKGKPVSADDGKGDADAKPNEVEAPLTDEEIYTVHPKSYYEFQLVGVVIHVGNAQAGHYYSIIRERGSDKWLEFNDSTVRPFDIKSLPEEAFGGKVDLGGGNKKSWELMIQDDNIKNAYLLVYDRKTPISKEPEVKVDVPGAVLAPKIDEADVKLSDIKQLVDSVEFPSVIPRQIAEAVSEDNLRFLKDRQVYSPLYFKFVLDFLKSFDYAPFMSYQDNSENSSREVISFGITFAFDVLAHASDNTIFKEFVEFFATIFEKNYAACGYFLQELCSDSNRLVEVILGFREAPVRISISRLISRSMEILLPFEVPFLGVEEEVELESAQKFYQVMSNVPAKMDKKVVKRKKSIVERTIDSLLGIWEAVPKNWIRFAEYFAVFNDFAMLGDIPRQILLQRGVIAKFTDLFLGEKSPLAVKGKSVTQIGSKAAVPSFDNLLKTVALLVRSCYTDSGNIPPGSLTDAEGKLHVLSAEDRVFVLQMDLYRKIFDLGLSIQPACDIIKHWSYEWKDYSVCVEKIIVEGVRRASGEDVRPYVELMTAFFSIEDSLQMTRMENLLAPKGGVINLLEMHKNAYQRFAYAGIKAMMKGLDEIPKYAEYMSSIRPQWVWMDRWLKDFITSPAGGYGPPSLLRQESRSKVFEQLEGQVLKFGGSLVLDTPAAGAAAADPGEEQRVAGDGEVIIPVPQGGNQQPRNPAKRLNPSSPAVINEAQDEELNAGTANVYENFYGDQPAGQSVKFGPNPYPTAAVHLPALNTDNSSNQAKWNCPVCTFENEGWHSQCEMCDSSRNA
eukprot:TRINITY_DN28363_c0_g1_i1.p1 TRINITY_DN28363_c0_g1~~TRINITY_DN28363_c0_g1_i1.p1  ORF type:complete len:1542 (+),score=408.46 TRINITY_DN28363_c0_g1_i1:345-4628(+)